MNPDRYLTKARSVGGLIGAWFHDELSGAVAADKSRLGHNGTLAGGVRQRQPGVPGIRGFSTLFAEVTENLITNPSFETNTAGWTTGGANTIEKSTEQAKEGSNSLKCIYQDDTDTLARFAITLTAVPHATSFWIYVSSDYDGDTLKLEFTGFVGIADHVRGTVDMTLRDQWQLVSAFGTPDAGDLIGFFRLRESVGTPTAGRFVYIDSTQCEAKAYATPYCDGSLGTGFSWQGVAHASKSDRAATYCDVETAGLKAVFNGKEGALLQVLRMYLAGTWGDGLSHYAVEIKGDANNELAIYKNATDNIRMLYKANGVAAFRDYPTSSLADLFMAITWSDSGNVFRAFAQGTQVGADLAIDTWSAVAGVMDRAIIGAVSAAPANPFTGYLAPTLLFNEAKTPAEIAMLSVP